MINLSLVGAIGFFTEMALTEKYVDHHALTEAAKIVKEEAQRVLGTYDYGWEPLAASTVEHKAAGDSPGYETGDMLDSIGITVKTKTADIGSDEDKALWFELGTVNQPPRSFLLQAAMTKEREVADKVGDEVFLFMSTGRLRGSHSIKRYPNPEAD